MLLYPNFYKVFIFLIVSLYWHCLMSQIKMQLQSHDVIYIYIFYCFAQLWRQVSNLVQYYTFNLIYFIVLIKHKSLD